MAIFNDLNDEASFVKFVTCYFSTAPERITSIMSCSVQVNESRVKYAHSEYLQNLETFSVLLHSSDPDHYKRAGALLHALIQSGIGTVNLESSAEELAAGYTRVSAGDAEHHLPFVEFYEKYHNEALSFGLAYKCCDAYEDESHSIDFDYLRIICYYLKANPVGLDTCFILFKSLMR